MSDTFYQDSDDGSGLTWSLADYMWSSQYLVVGLVESNCSACHTVVWWIDNHTTMQSVFNEWTCGFITLVHPTYYQWSLSQRKNAVWASDFVWMRSYKWTTSTVSKVEQYFWFWFYDRAPTTFIVDRQWTVVATNIVWNNWPSQSFYTYCGGWGTTTNGSTSQWSTDEWSTDAWSTTSDTTTAWSTSAWTTTSSNNDSWTGSLSTWWVDNNSDWITDSIQTGYVQTISWTNNNIVTLSVNSGSNTQITSFASITNSNASGGYFPAWVFDFTLSTNAFTVPVQLFFTNVAYQTWLQLQKLQWNSWVALTTWTYTLTNSGWTIIATYIITDNGSLDTNFSTWVIVDPITLGCADPDGDMICGISSVWPWTWETNTWSVSCSDGILNWSETDVDCGWSCFKCVNWNRCTLNSDCTSANCAYNVLRDWSIMPQRVLFDRPIWVQWNQMQNLVSTNLINQKRRKDTLLIKFKKDNKLLLPTYADTMILNSEERYIGYLVGKVASMYEQNGVAPLLMVRAIDQLFDYDVDRIDHVFSVASATPQQDDLANIYRVTFDTLPQLDALIAQLKTNLAVEFVEKEPIYTVSYNDPEAVNQRYLWAIEADKARDAWASGHAWVVIAVIDNGFDLTHPDLQWTYVAWRDVANNDSDPSIPSSWASSQFAWHGTHTLWLAWASTNNTLWIASIWWWVRVMPIKATFDSSSPENITHAIEAISYAVSQPQVKIISMSFWWPNTNSTLDALIAAHPEKIFVAAAWNDNVNTIQYPAASPGVIAVSAVDLNGQKASFANYGSWIDIVAPWTSILSTVPGWTYASYQWTSMATPIVASALWLLASLGDTNPFDTIMKTADALPNATHFQQWNLWSWRLNVCRAVFAQWVPCVSTNTWWLGRWICLVAGSTWTGWQTGTGWSTWTWWQTGTWVTLSGDQQYPVWSINLSVSNSSPLVGDTLQWVLDRSYTSHAPQYPAGTLDLFVNLPPWISFVSGSYSLLWDGTFQWYDVDNWDPVFVMALTWRPTSTTTTSRTFAGKVIFKTLVTSTVANLRVSISAQNLCYWLPIQNYIGTMSCSTSQNRQSWLEMSEDTVNLTLNRASTSTWSTNNGSTSWWLIVTWWTANVCGNWIIELNEQCDDWNKSSKDWCSSCIVESWWRCLPTSPSQCGTDDCHIHWKAFSEKNIFWTCCGWLSSLQVIPSSAVVTWVDKATLCYDPIIWQPFCDPKWSPSGWYVPSADWSTDFVMNDSCRSIYKDYYQEIMHELQWDRTVCLFADVAYDEVRFKDISSTKQKESIELLRNACIVQWIGSNLDSFWPKRPITRAELIKMVVKLIQLSEWTIPVWDPLLESWAMANELLFFDVPVWFWWASYIQEAVKRWLLLARAKQWLMTFFKPYATVTREEFIDLVRRIPQWQVVSREMIIDLLDKRAVVTRAAAAEVLVKKFLPVLQPYFYYQGNQEEYYWQLADELRGKNYKQQYDLLLQQINKLEEKKEEWHGSPDSWLQSDYDPHWMQQFIRKIIK
jgi:cysteine-rich repeat protein